MDTCPQPKPADRILDLISIIETRQSKNRESLRGQVKTLLSSFRQARREMLLAMSPRFNVVDLCGLSSDERTHSAILAWLLDQTGGHAQGTVFMKAFAELSGLDPGTIPPDYVVRTEFPGFESITDIVVFKPGDFFLSLENKLLALEGEDQLNREYRDLQRYAESQRIPLNRRLAVFLTPEGRQPQTGDPTKWHQISYSQLAATLKAVAIRAQAAKLDYFIQDWLSNIEALTNTYAHK